MSLAQPGEVVVCVNPDLMPGQPKWKLKYLSQLRKGHYYRVMKVDPGKDGPVYILKGLKLPPLAGHGWLPERFRRLSKSTQSLEQMLAILPREGVKGDSKREQA